MCSRRCLLILSLAAVTIPTLLRFKNAFVTNSSSEAGKIACVAPNIIIPPDESKANHSTVEAKYVLTNTGNTKVKITDIHSGCGCAKPMVDSEFIPPGGATTVTIRANRPPSGSKKVDIVVSLDSATTPTLTLSITLFGNMTPPYILDSQGDLTFNSESQHDDVRAIEITTVEPQGPPQPPNINSDFPFVSFKYVALQETPYPYFKGVVRRYQYQAKLTEYKGGTTSGIAVATPKWDSKSNRKIPIHIRDTRELRVVPSTLRLDYKLMCLESNSYREFIVLCPTNGSDLPVARAIERDPPFEISAADRIKTSNAYAFRIIPKCDARHKDTMNQFNIATTWHQNGKTYEAILKIDVTNMR